ncbi:ABC transporter ATP-binding protein [Lachnospiraceae bacterium]|jgi:ABC-2 type transport system ATP-binding protein|nr:ABC transporter ATP-binding protein [uncultured Schaedlerella sp.]EOS39162.1 hypothetical protein C808_02017 [Lachnospiraceae bacterium M18-1]MCI9152546.1 ABC transporter ATP-binding protein [Ruminococcus sp.]NBI59953.1 ABC transporter ATP-binding protein [Lachnospiraceae bacterium]
MITISGLTKYYDGVCAVNHVSLEILEGTMFGLLGTNGAGKTTLLRMLAGIIEADSGEIRIDGEEDPFSPQCKKNLFYLPDDPYYFPNASIQVMLDFYKKQYPGLDADSVRYMAESLNLDMNRPVRTFSKGMKRQAFLILALCSRTKYLFCDEVLDGLDPIAAEIMKNLFRQEMKSRDFTILVASHKLRDLEDICGNIAILHKGGVVTAGDFRERAENVRKFQCVFPLEADLDSLRQHPSVVRLHEDARFITLVTRGKAEEIRKALEELDPIFLGEVPLSLEETFIAEMEGAGYDIRKVLQ